MELSSLLVPVTVMPIAHRAAVGSILASVQEVSLLRSEMVDVVSATASRMMMRPKHSELIKGGGQLMTIGARSDRGTSAREKDASQSDPADYESVRITSA